MSYLYIVKINQMGKCINSPNSICRCYYLNESICRINEFYYIGRL